MMTIKNPHLKQKLSLQHKFFLHNKRTLLCTSMLSAMGLLITNQLQAQTVQVQAVTKNSDIKNRTAKIITLKDTIVKGERLDRKLSDTAASVDIIDDSDIELNPQHSSVKQSINGLPNVSTYGNVGAPVIRGQDTQGPNSRAGAFFGGTVPRASIAIDGRRTGYNELYYGHGSTWDVDTIEVFRGPQTTTQGANSIAGAVIVNTKDPSFTREGALEVQAGSSKKRRISAVLSGAITQDIAARVTFDHHQKDSRIEYTNPKLNTNAIEKDFSNQQARLKLLYKPEAMPALQNKLTVAFSQSNGPQEDEVTLPFTNYTNNTNALASWDIRTKSFINDTDYKINNVRLHNQLQSTKLDVKRNVSAANNGAAEIARDEIVNELRVNYDFDQLSGVSGIYYSNQDADESLNFNGLSTFDDEKNSLGIYTDVTYRINQIALSGGLRYQQDKVTRDGTSVMKFLKGKSLNYDESFDEVLPKVSLAYSPQKNITLGAVVSKGYNPGGVSLSFRQTKFVPFKPETLWNYELFSRANLFDNHLLLTSNLFYSDIKDSQRYVITPLTEKMADAITINAERANSYGLEMGATYQVTDALNVKGNVGVLKTQFEQFDKAVFDFKNKEFAMSPDYSANLGFAWDMTDKLSLNANVRHTGSYYSDDENKQANKIDPISIANARLAYSPNDHITVSVFANNIFDEQKPLRIRDFGRRKPDLRANMTQQRELGVSLKTSF